MKKDENKVTEQAAQPSQHARDEQLSEQEALGQARRDGDGVTTTCERCLKEHAGMAPDDLKGHSCKCVRIEVIVERCGVSGRLRPDAWKFLEAPPYVYAHGTFTDVVGELAECGYTLIIEPKEERVSPREFVSRGRLP
jgi:hypothetical protein